MAGWSWEATLGMGSPSDHRCIPIRVRSPTPYPNLACFVDQAAFVLGFVPTTSLQQMAGVVANALCITSQTQIELNLDSAEAIATPAEVSLPTETHDWGRVHIVHETETVGLYHLELSPNGLIPRHIHEHMAETELVVSSGISCQDGRLAPGTILSWPKRTPHLYRNTNASAPASILCVNQPRFDHIDEVVVDESVTNSIQLNEAKRALHYDPWRHMLSHGAEFRFNGAFPGQVVTYFVRDEIRLDADAALVVIADASEVVICQHHKRGWELPGGKRDPGETIQDTAHREALEETGIVLNPELISLGYFIGVGPDSRHIKQVFRASIAKRGDLCSKHEMLDVALIDLVEFASRASSGEPDISFLCRDSVINIIAALVRARI